MWKIYKHIFPNGKIYIGQTKNSLVRRFQNGEGYKYQFVYKAIQKYGWDNIITEIIEDNIPTLEEANKKEEYYIALYNARNPNIGYNIAVGGNVINKADYNSILQEWNNNLGINEIARKLNYNRSTVAKALEAANISIEERTARIPQSISHSNRQFDYEAIYNAWLINSDYDIIEKQFNCSEDSIRRALKEYGISEEERRKSGQKKLANISTSYNRKKVNQYDLNNNYIQTFNSIAEANLSLGKEKNASNIGSVCNGKRKTAYGYKWQYAIYDK